VQLPLSNLPAAVGRAQLARLDGFIERRRKINRMYWEALEGIDRVAGLPEAPDGCSTCWLPPSCSTKSGSESDPSRPASIQKRRTSRPAPSGNRCTSFVRGIHGHGAALRTLGSPTAAELPLRSVFRDSLACLFLGLQQRV
jgi:hypothetical protein